MGLGCVIHNDNQEWIAKCAKFLGKVTNNVVEMEALVEGPKLSLALDIRKLVIEGDSQIILNTIRKRGTPN